MPIRVALIGLASGFIGTKVMERVTTKMLELEPASDRRREKDVQPRAAYVVAAERMAGVFGARLDERRAERLGTSLHYGLGASWGLVYVAARALTGWHPIALGPGTGLVMFALVDEALNTALRFAAPPQRFPLWTHARGLVGHLVYGGAVAAVTELLLRAARVRS